MSDNISKNRPDGRVLRKVSSIVLNSPTAPKGMGATTFSQPKLHSPQVRGGTELDLEIVPDSEEERRCGNENERGKELVGLDVIEISSDEDDRNVFEGFDVHSRDDPFVLKVPGAWPVGGSEPMKPTSVGKLSGRDWFSRSSHVPKIRRTYRSRMIVQSSSSEGSDDDHEPQQTTDVIELSDSSREGSPGRGSKNATKSMPAALPTILALYSDEDSCSDDGAILTLNEPRSARKLIHVNPSHAQSITAITDPTLFTTPSRPNPLKDFTATPRPPRSGSSPTKYKQAPRTGKKAQAAAEQARRAAYAQRLFTDLNRVVFGDGLPHATKLNWNKRLLTTAGRAKWHKSRDGVQTTEIELAEKILDCDERIRNTLSHEMCHLATWILNANPKEGHGKLWKGWAAKVMRKCPEITITTRHDYEISHPFEWECEKCAKIYGRFSKSIRPDECVCGACKEGKLVPLFSDSRKMPKTPKTSRNASAKPKDSPCSLPRPQTLHLSDETNDACPTLRGAEHYSVYTVHASDSDIEVLTTTMGSVTILETS